MLQYLVLALIVLVVAAVIGECIMVSRKTFLCPNCNKGFRVPWYKVLITPHYNSERILKCPFCSKENTIKPQ